MRRTASIVLMCAWGSFAFIGALRLLAEGGIFPESLQLQLEALLDVLVLGERIDVDSTSAVSFAGLLFGVVALIGASVRDLASEGASVAERGERLAAVSLTALFAFWAAAAMAGSPAADLFGSGSALCFAFAATLGALVFDHAIYADETESDEAFDYVMRKIELAQKAAQREEAQRRDQNEDRG